MTIDELIKALEFIRDEHPEVKVVKARDKNGKSKLILGVGFKGTILTIEG